MTLPLTDHGLVSWHVLGSRPAYGDETDFFTSKEYGCSCGDKFGQIRAWNSGHDALNAWFTMHCLTALGASFTITEHTVESAVNLGYRAEPTEFERRWLV